MLPDPCEGPILRFSRSLRREETARFFPESAEVLPTEFELSQGDRADAEKTGRPALLSVFERARTTLNQARAIAQKPDRIAFELLIEEVIQVPVPGTGKCLVVLRDPLEGVQGALPGADGHCGIRGLERPKAAPKADFYKLRAKLARLASLIRE